MDSPVLCLGFANGKLLTHNYEERCWNVEKYLPKVNNEEENMITSIKFSYKDIHLSIGTSTGSFWSLHPTTLEAKSNHPFQMEKEPILGIRYSYGNDICVFWDATMAICIFIYDYDEPTNWKFMKRVRAHFKPIVDLIFIHSTKLLKNRMVTIGEDKYLVEYDMQNIDQGEVDIISCTTIEQTAIPTCLVYYTKDDSRKFLISENKVIFQF